MVKTITDLERQIGNLEEERAGIQQALAGLATERADLQKELTQAQAAAERTGDPEHIQQADQAEQRDLDLQRLSQRKAAALKMVEQDLQQARESLEAAQKRAKEARLQAIRKEAGALADRLDKDLDQANLWAELQQLHRETVNLVHSLYGQDQTISPGTPGFAQIWKRPEDGLLIRLNYITRTCLGTSLNKLVGGQGTLRDPNEPIKPVPSLRAALKLD
jgi:hypothetical protein